MSASPFREAILRMAPGWLRGAPGSGGIGYIGSKYLYSIGLEIDALQDAIKQGIRKRHPTYIAPGDSQPDGDALTLIGNDRTIPQGVNESNTSYGIRLKEWVDDLKMSGSAWATLKQIQGYLSPNRTTLRLVNNWGVWYTMNADYSTSLTISPLVANIPNWNWDGAGPWQQTWSPLFAWSRFWPIIYCSGGKPFDIGPRWGDPGARYATPGRTWGTTATSTQVAGIRNIVKTFKAAHSRCVNIIIAFDSASFNPAGANGAPLPDGTWGRWANPTSSPFGNERARLNTARYWNGPA